MADGTPTLKDFALALYAREGVPPACLTLQESAGLDVNILLFAAWRGAALRLEIGAADIAAARALVAEWHGEVVRPLRAIRRRLKTGPHPAPDARTAKLRAEVQAIEIAAEIIELEELGTLANGPPAPPDANAAALAFAAMAQAVEAFAGRSLTSEEEATVRRIASAV
ncbi:TIGR02444 family protein [Xanthobacter autotrophicus]|uniref:TIGR02444 family protein n=1 Tax=Xanthobacter TaxID=279 RepID=UPI0024AA9359|nr:TIGR02444 family protein [Xanthobacter autotrophicus]MDI4666145.1 TIGR02444 family protein [Xanthobacter autotrophicus]